MVYFATALSVAGAVANAAGAFNKAKADGANQRQQAITERVRAEATLDDLEFVRIELGMGEAQRGMAERAVAAQVAGQSARQGKLALDREMIELEAVQAEEGLRRGLRIQHGAEIAAAVAMGIDPFASASFGTMATEARRLMEESAANIRINAMAAKGQVTLEQANEFASTAALIQQQGALAMERMSAARAQVSLAHQERMGNYAVKVADRGFAAGTATANNAWVAGAGSLFSAYSRGGGFGDAVNTGVKKVAQQLSLGYRYLTMPALGTPPT